MYRIALISDIHKGELIECRPGEEARKLLDRFLEICKKKNVNLILDLGDRVNNKNRTADIANLEDVASVFSSSGIPTIHVIGNHDIHYMEKKDNLSILGLMNSYYSLKKGNLTFLILDTADPVWDDCGGCVSDRQIEWLKSELEKADSPVVVASHHPVYDQYQEGNPFFVKLPGQYKVKNSEKVFDIIKKSGKVIACLNGHVHWLYQTEENGIDCISVPSLTEAYPMKVNAPGIYSIIDFTDNNEIVASFESIVPERVIGKHVHIFK